MRTGPSLVPGVTPGSPALLPGPLRLGRILCHPPWIPFGVRMAAELTSFTETVLVCEVLVTCSRRLLPAIPRGCSSAGCVGRPRRATPATFGGDRGLAGPAPVPAGAGGRSFAREKWVFVQICLAVLLWFLGIGRLPLFPPV